MLKLASWNVNGLRAVAAKADFAAFLARGYDIVALQETKAAPEQVPEALVQKLAADPLMQTFYCSSVVKKGYSGTAVFSRIRPLNHRLELPFEQFAGEGRIIHLEYPGFHFINGYFPNGGAALTDERGRPTGRFARVPYKMGFFESFFAFAQQLRETKPVVVCGDFNIAHREIDLANPRENAHNTGFLPEERAFLDRFTAAGYLDTFRLRHGEERDRYSWWSYKTRARARNVGWRIDYFFVSEELREQVAGAEIEDGIYGSDHCPVTLELDLPG